MTYKVIAYYSSWAVHRKNEGTFTIDDIDSSLLTHAIYAFVGINPDGTIRIRDPKIDVQSHGFQKFNELKKRNAKLKTMVSMGGWSEGSKTFSKVAGDSALRQKLATNVLHFLREYGFDGLDLDWEYPAQRGGSPDDKENVILLLQELRKTLDAANKGYLLSAAVSASEKKATISYDTANFCKNLNFVNLMTYNLHGAFDGKTGQNAPLFPSPTDSKKLNNVDSVVRGWLGRGAPASKLILGLAASGRSFTVQDPNNHDYNNSATAGKPGPLINQEGVLGYNEICKLKQEGGWIEEWDDVQKVPFMYKDDQWVGFDNERSIREKANYAKSKNLGGAMVWAIDRDDFRGYSGNTFPLFKTLNKTLN